VPPSPITDIPSILQPDEDYSDADEEEDEQSTPPSDEPLTNMPLINAALSLLYDKLTHIQEQQTLMFAQMNTIELNMSQHLNPDTPSIPGPECSCPIIVSTVDDDGPTAASEAWRDRSLKREVKEQREAGYDGSFVLAGVRMVEGGEGIARPSGKGKGKWKKYQATVASGSNKGKEKARYQATVTDGQDEPSFATQSTPWSRYI
jgi:hypothetical protein